MSYKVGQIFYLVGAETAKVIPFRIVEEVTRTTMKGIEKSFIAEMPDENNTTVDVEKLKGEVFKDIKTLRAHMMSNAADAIERMIENAKLISSEAFQIDDQEEEVENLTTSSLEKPEEKQVEESEAVIPNSTDLKTSESATVQVDIGNGVVANMKVSDLDKVAQP